MESIGTMEEGNPISTPPVFEERRRTPDRRSRAVRRARPRATAALNAVAAAVAICGGLVVVYLFFTTVAQVNLLQAAAGTVATVGLLSVWLAGAFVRALTIGPGAADVRTRERERRGF
jgi:hypothetical protein